VRANHHDGLASKTGIAELSHNCVDDRASGADRIDGNESHAHAFHFQYECLYANRVTHAFCLLEKEAVAVIGGEGLATSSTAIASQRHTIERR
jgi:hypothetical protein